MASAELTHMEAQVEKLRSFLLPRQFSPTGTYRYYKREAARTLAYRLMVHAEFEHYLETRSVNVALDAWQKFNSSLRVTPCALALVAFHQGKKHAVAETLTCPSPAQQADWEIQIGLGKRLKAAVDHFRDTVHKGNHGIREKNVLALLLPIGVDPNGIDSVWLTTLDQFGMSRGFAAHKSCSLPTPWTSADPLTEYNLVTSQLLPGWRLVDGLLDSLT